MKTHIGFLPLVVLFALFAQGCVSLHEELPLSRFESPETNGLTRRFQLAANVTQTADDTLVVSPSLRPPDFTRPSLDPDSLIGGSASLGLIENLDIGFRTSIGPTPYLAVAKYQLMGPSASEAKDGDVSVAVTVMGGANTTEREEKITLGTNNYNWSGKVHNVLTDVALILGQRLGDHILLYGGGFYSNYAIDTTIDQEANSNGPAASYTGQTTGYQKGANVGLQFFFGSSPTFSQVEAVYSDVHVSNRDRSFLRASASLGFQF